MEPSVAGSRVRLSELVASLSLATDLGLGQPMEHVLRSCVVGLRIAAAALPNARKALVGGGHLIDPAAPEVLAFIEEVLGRP